MSALAAALALALAAAPIGGRGAGEGNHMGAPVRSSSARALRVAATPHPGRGAVRAPTAVADPWFGADKVRHLVLAAHAEGVAFAGATLAGARRDPSLALAVGVAAALSVGKEVHDRRAGRRFSWRDLAWDAAGMGLSATLLRRVGYD